MTEGRRRGDIFRGRYAPLLAAINLGITAIALAALVLTLLAHQGELADATQAEISQRIGAMESRLAENDQQTRKLLRVLLAALKEQGFNPPPLPPGQGPSGGDPSNPPGNSGGPSHSPKPDPTESPSPSESPICLPIVGCV